MQLLTRWYTQVLLLAIAVTTAYCCTLDVPFYLDDFSSIQENPVIYHWQGTLTELFNFSALRVVGYFTFALNYQIHQFQVAGYHIVNLIIHFLAGGAVFGLMRGLVRTPALNETLSIEAKQWLPLVVALFFLLHPLQIQSVTYIVQRLASLAALFYLTAMASFVQAQLSTQKLSQWLWILACLISAALAFLTKQNTVTLLIALLLLDLIFFPNSKRQVFKLISISMVLALTILGFILAFVFQKNPFSLEAMQALTQETTAISRDSYLATQFSVLWTYIRLFFLPIGLQIDYDYPLTAHLWQGQALLALTAHLLMISGAIYSVRRWPFVAFGLLFYYTAHIIESSVIPITDVVFEHRTYLPNLGLVILVGWLLVVQLPQWLQWLVTVSDLSPSQMKRASILPIIITVMLLTILGITTWQRNQLWRDPIALWRDNVEKSPQKRRAWVILGKHLIQANQPEQGIQALERSAEITTRTDGSVSKIYSIEAILNLVVAYKMLKRYDESLTWINYALKSNVLSPFDHAKFLINQGNVFYEQGHSQPAEAAYRQAIAIYPQNLTAYINLATILVVKSVNEDHEQYLEEAETLYRKILAIDPSNATALENLAKLQKLRSH